jgi:hypothetical protein
MAVRLLIGKFSRLPWSLPEGTVIRRVECEHDSEVDDVLLRLSSGGTVYLQFKHGLTLGSEFNKAIAQMVLQYHTGGFSDRDRLVIFTDPTASGTVRTALKNLLDRMREDPGADLAKLLVNDTDTDAFGALRKSVGAGWPTSAPAFSDAGLAQFLLSLHITALDLQAPETVANNLELLANVTDRDRDVWQRLVDMALTAARKRYGFDRLSLWEMLRRDHIDLALAVAGGRDGTQLKMDEVAGQMTDEAVSFHVKLNFFDPARYVVRGALDLEWRTFCASDARLLVLAGESGHGKTNALIHYSSVHDRPLLLIRGEELEQEDPDLCSSVCRLVAAFCSRKGLRPPTEYELRQWLGSADLMLIVDGLDRSTLSGLAASRWMNGTFAWLGSTSAKLVLGTRPESWTAAGEAPLRLPWLMYVDAQGRSPLLLELFTPEEARLAAERLGRPDLARYRHPGMMSLAAALSPREARSLRHSGVIDGYLAFRCREIANLAASTKEEVWLFLDQVAAIFLRGGGGGLPAAALAAPIREAREIYHAVRNTNLLVDDHDTFRLHPDEVAEHLQARQLDIGAELERVEEILDLPIRLGILRSAIVQLEARDPEGARGFVGQLIDRLEAGHPAAVRAQCVAIALELRAWDGWLDLFARVVRSWTQTNLILHTDPIAELLASPRLAAMERVALLWEIVWGEDGWDWRPKHWLPSEYMPDFETTLWGRLMQEAMIEAGADGLAFALEHFDDLDDLDCPESCLGDLAQGLFFRGAARLTSQALDLLDADRRASALEMADCLFRYYPDASLAWLRSRLATLSDRDAVDLLFEIPAARVGDRYRELAATLLARVGGSALRRRCLLALVRVGDMAAAEELARLPQLYGDELVALLRTEGQVFAAVSALLFGRLAEGSLPSEAFSGVYLSGVRPAELGQLLVRMEAQVARDPGSVSSFSRMLEDIVPGICRGAVLPAPLQAVVDAMLAHGSDAARRTLIDFATNALSRRHFSVAGLRFQMELLDRLLATETSEDNLRMLVLRLVKNEPVHAFADECVASLCQRFPEFDLKKGAEVFYWMRGKF